MQHKHPSKARTHTLRRLRLTHSCHSGVLFIFIRIYPVFIRLTSASNWKIPSASRAFDGAQNFEKLFRIRLRQVLRNTCITWFACPPG